MQKRGQITIFIILGLILLALFLMILFLLPENSISDTSQATTNFNFAPIKNYVDSCLEKTLEEGLIFLGQHGGYVTLPNQIDLDTLLPYYYIEGKSFLPTLETYEDQLTIYIDEALPKCLQNFELFTKQGFSFEQGSLKTAVIMAKNKVITEINFPIRVSKGIYAREFTHFASEYSISYPKLHDFLTKFMEKQQDAPNHIPIEFLINQDSLRFNYSVSEDGKVLYDIIDYDFLINEQPHTFSFMFKYDWETEEDFFNEEDTIDIEDEFDLGEVGE